MQNGTGWFIFRLNPNDKIEKIFGPLGNKDKAIKQSINYFPHIYIIEEIEKKFIISYMETESNESCIEISNDIENLKLAQQNVVCLLKTEKIKNSIQKNS